MPQTQGARLEDTREEIGPDDTIFGFSSTRTRAALGVELGVTFVWRLRAFG